MVRAMTDEEARRAQIAENLQRADMHPIEEAEGLQALIDRHCERRQQHARPGRQRPQLGLRPPQAPGGVPLRSARPAWPARSGTEVALPIARLRTPKLQEKALGYEKLQGTAAQWRNRP
jgi:ParB-like chromosome segregation protein Spo0J